ncbi:hypothetical protein JQS43_10175 [Natronosporangium hydrolyticum]|uniref:General stress protein 17M-like domain-containing protein n=1 Tax=Natronosporangium hydrolyticum TaxID=2811111 RepID=A0A895YKQ9_9ACTN|nr:general stress protein [Natronosporangium hydrolyticum]QSB16602.1 hypothetical protein JQS43_10175 [Natronosporangium hydrolyticum]
MVTPLGGTDLPVEQTRRVTVATYGDYASAQRAVDFLSDNQFPVDRTAIIGTDLRLVETVLGRLTVGRAALQGTAVGAWFGLFIGLLFGIFAVSGWLAVVIAGVLIGALFGAIFGALAQAFTRGQRDFSSRRSLVAAHYDVTVDGEYAEQASRLLATLPAEPNRG